LQLNIEVQISHNKPSTAHSITLKISMMAQYTSLSITKAKNNLETYFWWISIRLTEEIRNEFFGET
jgi:hypothetical protein